MSATAFQRMRRERAFKESSLLKNIDDMNAEELIWYAEKNNIDIGRSTSKSGILKKIKESESGVTEQEEATDDSAAEEQ